jgi:pimeloyl-ACP methyl ester carboxylesterase
LPAVLATRLIMRNVPSLYSADTFADLMRLRFERAADSLPVGDKAARWHVMAHSYGTTTSTIALRSMYRDAKGKAALATLGTVVLFGTSPTAPVGSLAANVLRGIQMTGVLRKINGSSLLKSLLPAGAAAKFGLPTPSQEEEAQNGEMLKLMTAVFEYMYTQKAPLDESDTNAIAWRREMMADAMKVVDWVRSNDIETQGTADEVDDIGKFGPEFYARAAATSDDLWLTPEAILVLDVASAMYGTRGEPLYATPAATRVAITQNFRWMSREEAYVYGLITSMVTKSGRTDPFKLLAVVGGKDSVVPAGPTTDHASLGLVSEASIVKHQSRGFGVAPESIMVLLNAGHQPHMEYPEEVGARLDALYGYAQYPRFPGIPVDPYTAFELERLLSAPRSTDQEY